MRFIHTADIHLDVSYSSTGMPGSYGNCRRQSLRDVFCAILARAREWPADAVLIAGDLFDVDYVSRDTISFLRSQFEAVKPIPVFITPGNHDPYLPDSPYADELWPENVVIFPEPAWTEHRILGGRVVIHGFGFDGYEPSVNPWESLRVNDDGTIHIAIGHGTERAHQPPDGKSYAPFDAAAVASFALQYLALGHFHAMTEITGDFLPTKMFYSGAPEGHDFSETGPRYYLEVEIDDAGKVDVRPVESARVIYTTHSLDCSTQSEGRPIESSQEVIELIRQCARESTVPQVARITLCGSCQPAIVAEMPAIYDAVASEFAYLDLIDETTPLEDYEELARETTTLGEFVRAINDEIRDATEPERRRLLERAREVGLAAYRADKLPIRGLGEKG